MRATFSVASKLLGVFLSYLGLIYLVTAFALGDGPFAPVLAQVLSAALAFVFGFILVFRTEWLRQLVGVSSEAAPSVGGLEPEAVLRTGIILIGLYLFATRVGLVLSTAASYLAGVHFGGIGGAPVRILIECVPLALAAFLVFRADRVVALVNGGKTPIS